MFTWLWEKLGWNRKKTEAKPSAKTQIQLFENLIKNEPKFTTDSQLMESFEIVPRPIWDDDNFFNELSTIVANKPANQVSPTRPDITSSLELIEEPIKKEKTFEHLKPVTASKKNKHDFSQVLMQIKYFKPLREEPEVSAEKIDIVEGISAPMAPPL